MPKGQKMNYNKSTAPEIDRVARTIKISRIFNAPPERLWRIHTEPTLIAKWWGSRSSTTRIEQMDVREGGRWRFVSQDGDGNVYAFRGEYKAVEPPKRLVWTFEFEGMPGHVTIDEYLFEAQPGGKTRLTNLSHYNSIEDLEGMLQSGMEEGGNESWDRAEDLLASP
jgi:uncharacterized protein YndB with AHSA1/START domain